MAERSVQITVTATTFGIDEEERRYALSVEGPHGSWSLPELQQLAYETANTAGLVTEMTTAVSVEVRAVGGCLRIP